MLQTGRSVYLVLMLLTSFYFLDILNERFIILAGDYGLDYQHRLDSKLHLRLSDAITAVAQKPDPVEVLKNLVLQPDSRRTPQLPVIRLLQRD